MDPVKENKKVVAKLAKKEEIEEKKMEKKVEKLRKKYEEKEKKHREDQARVTRPSQHQE